MNFSIEDILILQRFLENEMPLEERRNYKNILKINPDLQEMASLVQLMPKAFEVYHQQQEIADFSKIYRESSERKTNRGTLRMLFLNKRIVAAASLLILCSFCIGFFLFINVKNHQLALTYHTYISNYFEKHEQERRISTPSNLYPNNLARNYNEGKIALTQHSYKKAQQFFEVAVQLAIKDQNPLAHEIQLYLVTSYIGMGEIVSAQILLDDLLSSDKVPNDLRFRLSILSTQLYFKQKISK